MASTGRHAALGGGGGGGLGGRGGGGFGRGGSVVTMLAPLPKMPSLYLSESSRRKQLGPRAHRAAGQVSGRKIGCRSPCPPWSRHQLSASGIVGHGNSIRTGF